jgi:hypothetical protein
MFDLQTQETPALVVRVSECCQFISVDSTNGEQAEDLPQ